LTVFSVASRVRVAFAHDFIWGETGRNADASVGAGALAFAGAVAFSLAFAIATSYTVPRIFVVAGLVGIATASVIAVIFAIIINAAINHRWLGALLVLFHSLRCLGN
jgi:hypothetical protein